MTTSAPAVPQVPLEAAEYSTPRLECDVVMKGGITSGVVYPLAVCELARTYRFRCIGGTSAGAIAAAATAAAEYGRRNGGSGRTDGRDANYGFRELAGLPEWLGRKEDGADRSNLFALFQPQPATDALFDVATAKLWGKSLLGRLVQRFSLAAALGLVPGVVVVWVGTQARPVGVAIVLYILGIALAGVGSLGAAGGRLSRRARREVPGNGFGLCSGDGADVNDPTGQWPALTPWLSDLINRLAGKSREQGALTFGDLWGPAGEDGDRDIDLRFMTTSLTHGRPYEFPFASRTFYYDPQEFARLFPAWVMKGMNEAARRIKQANAEERARRAAEEAAGTGPAAAADGAPDAKPEREPDPGQVARAQATWDRLLPLPKPRDLPVVIGARMSLSFPVLFSAVPLYAVDYIREDLLPPERAPERCWFSDGGICSNFPVHFFDTPLPVRPTFGINLRPFPEGQKPDAQDESKNRWLPEDNSGGIADWFARIPEGAGWKSLAGFGGLIVNAMQNWVDNTQLSVPGYRDRVAHVLLTAEEGGLNLNMPHEVIERLGERGQLAARELARRFDPRNVPADTRLTWDNHRWVRFRSSMQLLEDLLRELTDQYAAPNPGGRTYEDLVMRADDEPPASYRLRSRKRADAVNAALKDIHQLPFMQGKPLFEKGAPNPTPEIRIRPRL